MDILRSPSISANDIGTNLRGRPVTNKHRGPVSGSLEAVEEKINRRPSEDEPCLMYDTRSVIAVRDKTVSVAGQSPAERMQISGRKNSVAASGSSRVCLRRQRRPVRGRISLSLFRFRQNHSDLLVFCRRTHD